jgi:hypothetical protein
VARAQCTTRARRGSSQPTANASAIKAKTRQVQAKVRGRLIVHLSADEVAARMGPWVQGSIETLTPQRSLVQIGGRSVEDIAFWIGVLDVDFEVVDSPELALAVQRIADRYARATQ